MKGVRGQRPQILQHHISDQMHLRDPYPHPPPPKNFFAYLHLSQEWSWELGKNLKSDNYLKIFIPAIYVLAKYIFCDEFTIFTGQYLQTPSPVYLYTVKIENFRHTLMSSLRLSMDVTLRRMRT